MDYLVFSLWWLLLSTILIASYTEAFLNVALILIGKKKIQLLFRDSVIPNLTQNLLQRWLGFGKASNFL